MNRPVRHGVKHGRMLRNEQPPEYRNACDTKLHKRQRSVKSHLDMQLANLRNFLPVAETGSLRRTAEARHVSVFNGTSLSERSQDPLLPLFEARALDVARLCQQAVGLWPSFHRSRFTPIRS